MRPTLKLALLLASSTTWLAAAEPERADWWSTEKRVVEGLFSRDAGQWARELSQQPLPQDPGELMLRFSVFNRAGHLRQARLVIDAMREVKFEKSQLSSMADFLIGRQDWQTARYFLERLPQAEPGWGYVLIKEWATTGDAKQIDAWLAHRAKANPTYWLRERLRFRKDQGTAGELIEELAQEVRRPPHDVEVALRFVEATSIIGHNKRDLAWLGEVCRPPSAYASFRLGQALRAAPRAAIALLEHSLEMPFTKEDTEAIRAELSHSARAQPEPPSPEQRVRYATKHELLIALQSAGESARAQQLLEELARLQPDGLPPPSFDRLAGQIQAASGARVVQEKFEETAAERENQQSASYWLRRASYFTGRKEHPEAIAAYEKALQLAVPDNDKPAARSNVGLRSSVLSSYVFYLLQHSHHGKSAAVLLERELRQSPLDSRYAERIIDTLLHASPATTSTIDRELLWSYLSARSQWTRQEERLLKRLVEQSADPPQAFSRAEDLARELDPSRSLVLGWVMTRANASSRAIPWLKSALERLAADEKKDAAFTLFEAYLDTYDWRAAEDLWPTARQRLTATELPDWLGRIALAAARAGTPTDALRIWAQRTNLDRGSMIHIDDMLRGNLREPLLASCRALAERDPECQSIQSIMQAIQGFEY